MQNVGHTKNTSHRSSIHCWRHSLALCLQLIHLHFFMQDRLHVLGGSLPMGHTVQSPAKFVQRLLWVSCVHNIGLKKIENENNRRYGAWYVTSYPATASTPQSTVYTITNNLYHTFYVGHRLNGICGMISWLHIPLSQISLTYCSTQKSKQ